jgi:hypothetical protein
MSTKKEHPENYGWWISELDSLGIKRIKRNDMKDKKEITDMTIKLFIMDNILCYFVCAQD